MPVVSNAELVAAINAALTTPVLSHSATSKAYDLYEVYLFGLAIRAAESIGMTVGFEDLDGNPAAGLVLRTQPSSIWSTVQAFTHAVLFENGDRRLEVHLGVYVRAASRVSHEADVLVVDAAEAARARALHVDPQVKFATVVVEAKFHGANVRLRTGREFLGLTTDIGTTPTIFVASTGGGSVHRLLSHRKRAGHFNLIPGAQQEHELRSQIATKMRDFLVRS